jgi:hypothetical protein
MNKILKAQPFHGLVLDNFIFIRCPVSEDGGGNYPLNKDLPEFNSVPFFILLDEKGEVIASHDTSGFGFLWFYKKKPILEFIEKWAKL